MAFKRKVGYTTEIELYHHEGPARVDLRTGEYSKIYSKKNNIPDGKEIFEGTALFRKDYTNSWKFLTKYLTPLEFKAAHTLALISKLNTNSLEPLNDDTTIQQLMEILLVSKNKVKPILNKLWELGVYGKFEIKEADKPYTKYWIFNPYLSFSGKLISSDISNLFKNTHIAKAFYDEKYVYKR